MDIEIAKEKLKVIDIKFFLNGTTEQSNYIVDKADEINIAIETVLNLLENQKAKIEEKDKSLKLHTKLEYQYKNDYLNVIEDLKKKDKIINEYEKECRQFKAFCKKVRRDEKHDVDLFNQGQEQKCNQFLNLISGEPHWSYEGKYFDDTDNQIKQYFENKAEEENRYVKNINRKKSSNI